MAAEISVLPVTSNMSYFITKKAHSHDAKGAGKANLDLQDDMYLYLMQF